MKSLVGHLLVASPKMKDPNFARSVTLMLRHEESGALGVVLTQPGNKTVSEVWEMIEAPPVDCDDDVFNGGPVPGPMIALHDSPRYSEQEVLPGLHMAMQRDAIDQLVRSAAEFRLFSGHAGWGGGQLEGELQAGGWLKTPADKASVFSDYETLWQRTLSKIGVSIIAPDIDPSQVPFDPGLN